MSSYSIIHRKIEELRDKIIGVIRNKIGANTFEFPSSLTILNPVGCNSLLYIEKVTKSGCYTNDGGLTFLGQLSIDDLYYILYSINENSSDCRIVMNNSRRDMD